MVSLWYPCNSFSLILEDRFLTPGHRPLLVHVLLGNGSHIRRSVAGKQENPPLFTALPNIYYHLSSASCQISVGIINVRGLCCYRALALSTLCHIANSHWLSISHVIMYMFKCCSFKSSPPPSPLCPKVCSLCMHVGSSVPSF